MKSAIGTGSTVTSIRCAGRGIALRCRRNVSMLACSALVLLSCEAVGHGPLPASKAPAAGGKVPTLVEPVPLMKTSEQHGKVITNFEFYVGERFGVWHQEIYEIGIISEDQTELRFAVVRAYEPGKTIAHVTKTTALRVELRTGSGPERLSRGWLDAHEVAQLVQALPGIPAMHTAEIVAASNRSTEVAFPRGRIAIGLRNIPGDARDQRLFVRVGNEDAAALLKPDRFAELQALVNFANRTILEVQDKRGHHR